MHLTKLLLMVLSLAHCWVWGEDDEKSSRKVFQKSYPVALWGKPVSSPIADLTYGYILYNYKDLPTGDEEVRGALQSIWKRLCGKDTTLSKKPLSFPWSQMSLSNIRITFARTVELRYTTDGETWAKKRRFGSDETENIVMGKNYYVQFIAPDDSNRSLVHNITISRNRDNQYYLFHHTYVPSGNHKDYLGELSFYSHINRMTGQTVLTRRLRIISYNAWNTMPATWFLTGQPRFTWYYKRMRLMSKYIRAANPDVVVLQEIRYDETLGDHDHRFQLSHLADLLPGMQYVYQPANMYVERGARVEEGVAIFSKFPITHQDYIILSRDYLDKQDDHQRVVLHATIEVPYIGPIQVYGTHLSLSESARDRTVPELSDFIDANGRNGFSVFCGDLNAEPDSRAIQYLIGKGELNGKKTDYKDAFLQVHPEPKPRSPKAGARWNALTFPTDNPVKRIDYIIYKQGTGVHVDVYNTQLIGQKPWKGTETTDLMAGMQSAGSALYASDHRGVFADFVFN